MHCHRNPPVILADQRLVLEEAVMVALTENIQGSDCLISAAYRSDVTALPHCRRIRTFMLAAWLRGARLTALLSLT